MTNEFDIDDILALAKTIDKPFKLNEFLFDKQIALAKDTARFATAVCSVRAGKTVTCAADLVYTSINKPNIVSLYITLARSSAKRIVWPDLHRICEQFHVDAEFNESELSITFPNKSVIYCSGAKDASEMEKFRGLSNVELVYIDESQAFRAHIKELIEDILIKRLYDTNGRLRLIGTPGAIPAGYFYEASQSIKWSHHAWTLHDNPHIAKKSGTTVEALIQQDCDRKGVDINHPSIRRECFGEWVLDTNALLLEFTAKNIYTTLPCGEFTYILGMDFGFEDADAFTVIGWQHGSPNTYLVEELIAEKQTYEQMVANFDKLYKKYSFAKIVADPGGGGKKLIESLKQRYPIPFNIADKLGKIANYGLLNNALRTGRFLAPTNSRFSGDCNLLEKDFDKSTPEHTVVKGHSDVVDAVLYAFRESPAYSYVPPIPKPQKGTPEYDRDFADEMFKHTLSQLKRQAEMKDGQGMNWHDNDNEMAPLWNRW